MMIWYKVVALLATLAAGISSVTARNNTADCPPVEINFATISDGTSPMTLGFQDIWCGKNTVVEGGNLVLTLTKECGPNIAYEKQFLEGKVEVTLTTAWSSGVVSALALIANAAEKDEIDIEWVGKAMTEVQTMYFVKGKRVPGAEGGGIHDLGVDTSKTPKTYAMEYKRTEINWYIDGELIRTVENTGELPYPDQPLQLNMGVWDGSETSGWAGNVSWDKAVNGGFSMKVSHFTLTPYTCENYTTVPSKTNPTMHVETSIPAATSIPPPFNTVGVTLGSSTPLPIAPSRAAANTLQLPVVSWLFNMILTLAIYAKLWRI